MKGYTAMTTQFNKDTFVAQFSKFAPANDWEYKFAQSLHKQVVLWKKDLSEKQVACWEKLIAPKVMLTEDKLSDSAKEFISKAHQVISKCTVEEKSTIEFTKSLIDQVSQGKDLSDKQTSVFNRIFKKKTEVKVDPSKAVETPKAKTKKAVKVVEVETPKIENGTVATKTRKSKVAK